MTLQELDDTLEKVFGFDFKSKECLAVRDRILGLYGETLLKSRNLICSRCWMKDNRKRADDCTSFRDAYILDRAGEIRSGEELSFLLGYYAHLVTDAEHQRTIRDEKRVAAAWKRAKAIDELRERSSGLEETWDNFKKLFPDRRDRMKDFYVVEREYLDEHPDSGYFTEIRDLDTFPDYIDYLPEGAIPAKIRMMYYMPTREEGKYPFVGFSREECAAFLDRSVDLAVRAIEETRSLMDNKRTCDSGAVQDPVL